MRAHTHKSQNATTHLQLGQILWNNFSNGKWICKIDFGMAINKQYYNEHNGIHLNRAIVFCDILMSCG